LERKMCSISVEPIPSRISSPVLSFQLFAICGGRASPAETHSRSAMFSLLGKSGFASIAA